MSGRSSGEQLELIERIIDTASVARTIERLLPAGVRHRQLSARTLLAGMILTMLHGRDALLTNVHETLLELGEADRRRLEVTVSWKHGPHVLSYRQIEYTYRLICSRLAKQDPDGAPSDTLQAALDALLEASVRVLSQPASSSYAVDWTAHETWSRPPPKNETAAQKQTGPDAPQPAGSPAGARHALTDTQPAIAPSSEPTSTKPIASENPVTTSAAEQHARSDCWQPAGRSRRSDREAAWGHRTVTHPSHTELFYGYYLQAITTVSDEHGPPVPELARRIHLASPKHDPPAQIIPTITRMISAGIPVDDLLADSGYSYRQPQTFAMPARALRIQLTMDLHPNDRGPQGTHNGAIACNGNLYCPATPTSLLKLGPIARGASVEQTNTHDQQSAELARYKLAPITAYDQDGYRRVSCPAAQGKIRCPLRPASMTLPHNHPTIQAPPKHPPLCCTQKTLTVPPTVNAKTAQKHDYPSPEHRHAYNRRSAAERTFATLSDRSTNDLSRGWCRLTDLTSIALHIATAYIARNIRIADAFTAHQLENQQRATHGLPPRRRKHRRQTIQNLINAPNAPPQTTTAAA